MKITTLIVLILFSQCGKNKINFSLFCFNQRSQVRCLLEFLGRHTCIKYRTRSMHIFITRHEQRCDNSNQSSITQCLTIVQFLIFFLVSKSLLMCLLWFVMLLPIVNHTGVILEDLPRDFDLMIALIESCLPLINIEEAEGYILIQELCL